MKIGIHITTHNRQVFTDQCLKSFYMSEPLHTKLVIVDNASSDNTQEVLKTHHSKFEKYIHCIVYNAQNLHLGAAVRQGWNILKEDYDILGWINNDFLFEPGWESNLLACFSDLNLDYAVGWMLPEREKTRIVTESKKGFYVPKNDVGAAYFLLTKHFLNGVAPSPRPFGNKYVGPGPSFHKLLIKRKLRGIRLASPGILVRSSEYTNPDYHEYYNETFGIRGRPEQLKKFRRNEVKGDFRGGLNWQQFQDKYYTKGKV